MKLQLQQEHSKKLNEYTEKVVFLFLFLFQLEPRLFPQKITKGNYQRKLMKHEK